MFSVRAAFLVLLLWLSMAPVAFPQRGSRAQPNQVEIQVRVTYPNEQPAPQQLQVDLLNSTGVTMQQAFTNDLGQAQFLIAGSGNFRVKVSGISIEDAVSDLVQITQDDHFRMVYLQVRPKPGAETDSKSGTGAMTSAANLKIPPAARKSFEKGVEALQQKDYKKAVDLFEKATTAYPQYDAAYDNLGVALMNLGQTETARAAFERAVQLNDKNADADRNYARLQMGAKQYAAAKELLHKSLMVAPQDLASLTLLAISQLQTNDYDGAIQSAMKVHSISHQGYAVAHYVAGRAFENKRELQSAATEYQMYLQESPNGAEADQVRASLARVTATARAAPE